MPLDRFMIAPINGGLTTDQKPWLITDDSFSQLNNAYVFRGRVKKRFGSRLMNNTVVQSVAQLYSRVRVSLGTNEGVALSLPGIATQLKIGQMFSVGTDIYTVYQLGAAALTYSTNPVTTATINNTSNPNTVTFTNEGAVTVYYYPATPIMGFITYETNSSNTDPVFVFDRQFAYQFGVPTAGAFNQVGTAIWTGTDAQFFWGTTWGQDTTSRNLFVVNGNYPDQIKYWNGSAWTTIHPQISAVGGTYTLETALMTVVFKNRLIMLNTWEALNGGTPVQYTNRVRWAAFGDPLQTNGWRQDIPGLGNFLDAATMEDIVSCGFIKDRLIVYFERSTWELVYTGNQAQPFTWQKLNTELGAESLFSSVPFDKVLLTVGNVGVHACNGVNVQRVDDKIPDTVWQIHDGATEVNRVYGIRDYYSEQVYWTFPSISTNPYSATYPNKILVYNYKTGSWAFNDDSITAFGYYYSAAQSSTNWSSTDAFWNSNGISWGTGSAQTLNQEILAGNQEGYVFIVDANQAQNAPALQITNIYLDASDNVTLTVINHNLNVGDFIYVEWLNGLTGPFLSLYEISLISDANTFIIIAPDIQGVIEAGGVYTGGGTIARLSQINILTKQFNFYVDQDRNATIQRVDFLVDRTPVGEFTVDYLLSSSAQGTITQAEENGSLIGTSIVETSPYALYPMEATQDRLWHPTYPMAEGQSVQLNIYLSPTEMVNYGVVTSPFEIHAYTFYVQPTSARLQ
jgi:hypothetical protein